MFRNKNVWLYCPKCASLQRKTISQLLPYRKQTYQIVQPNLNQTLRILFIQGLLPSNLHLFSCSMRKGVKNDDEKNVCLSFIEESLSSLFYITLLDEWRKMLVAGL